MRMTHLSSHRRTRLTQKSGHLLIKKRDLLRHLSRQLSGCNQYFAHGMGDRAGRLVDRADFLRHFPGSLRGFVNIVDDVTRRLALILHRIGDRGRDVVDVTDRPLDCADSGHGFGCGRLDAGNLLHDVFGSLGGPDWQDV